MATLAIPTPGEPSLRDRIEDLAARIDRANDTVATSETPAIVPWPGLRQPVESPVEPPARATVAEEPIEQARKLEMLGRMAAGVAHDLNNLLAVIGGHAELLTIDSPERGPAHSDVIQTSIRLASQLTGRLLAFAKPAASFVSPVLGSVVAESAPLLRAIAGAGVECIVLNDGEPIRVPVRRDRIEQVALNLVANARDALTEAGVIVVQASAMHVGSDRRGWPADRPSGQYAVLTVADNGRGMDAATQSRIFERYFTTRGDKGTGLGLATVREIVDLAKGHVEVESAPGRGAIFRVFFPAEEIGTGFDRSIRELASGANDRTALLVDDDAGVRRLAKAWLESAGYDVIEARDGEEAARLERVVREPIDLLVTDYVMPGLGGRKLAERMRCSRPGLPIVFISGYGNPYERLEPGIRFVPKPFARSMFLEAVELVSRTVATA
jgi:two-component system, cell cycle sensor histidine kinase and response regulator CckA